jgi:queuine tRNA-ribosyltransferase
MKIQKELGSNIVMAFDQCPPFPATEKMLDDAMRRTLDWAKKGLAYELKPHQARFGIFQGGLDVEKRKESIEQLSPLPFDGFALKSIDKNAWGIFSISWLTVIPI